MFCRSYSDSTNTENIYNADETGLFWHLTPQKSLVFKNKKCFGGKKSKGADHCSMSS